MDAMDSQKIETIILRRFKATLVKRLVLLNHALQRESIRNRGLRLPSETTTNMRAAQDVADSICKGVYVCRRDEIARDAVFDDFLRSPRARYNHRLACGHGLDGGDGKSLGG